MKGFFLEFRWVHPCHRGGGGTLSGEEQPYQRLAGKGKYQKSGTSQQRADENFEPEGVADAVVVSGALELGGEDARAGGGAEDRQIKHKQQLVHNGNAAHGQGTHPAHHNVVQQ